jgi:uncharacterized protein with PIN domain
MPSGAQKPPASSPPRTRFITDAMLGSLTRKLRALGFDATYYREGDDCGLVEAAAREGRLILTSDRGVAALGAARGVRAFLLGGRSDGERVSALAKAFEASGTPLVRGAPLCSLCGGELEGVRRAEVAGRVPPSVAARHRLFYRCASCGQLYWRGSHWKKLRSLARRLDKTPIAPHA